MKKLLLSSALCFLNFAFCIAQNTTVHSAIENNNKWGIGVQVNTVDQFSQYENAFFNKDY